MSTANCWSSGFLLPADNILPAAWLCVDKVIRFPTSDLTYEDKT